MINVVPIGKTALLSQSDWSLFCLALSLSLYLSISIAFSSLLSLLSSHLLSIDSSEPCNRWSEPRLHVANQGFVVGELPIPVGPLHGVFGVHD